MLDDRKSFLDDENGAVTVDWVVLTAAIVGTGILVITTVMPSILSFADEIPIFLDDQVTYNVNPQN